ncbi:hypothetical protein [Leptospira idonii]|uniref:Uncharacterized protein n=1 Tax=Leptospira idonii TaxID=1193500 RepID=A0A4R9M0D4_9LEPT|nr:hypothetical protein [Leptospira idonii]TGN19492.1 hypothetical protein EHS15_09175 [Leptospira idonii]
MIKFILLSLLLFLIMRVISRMFSITSGQNSGNKETPKFYVYREGPGFGQTQIKKEKDISEKGRILED